MLIGNFSFFPLILSVPFSLFVLLYVFSLLFCWVYVFFSGDFDLFALWTLLNLNFLFPIELRLVITILCCVSDSVFFGCYLLLAILAIFLFF